MAKRTMQKRRPLAVPVGKFGRAEIAIAAVLAIVTLAIYAQAIGHQFNTLDDLTYVQENPMVNRGGLPPTKLGKVFPNLTRHGISDRI